MADDIHILEDKPPTLDQAVRRCTRLSTLPQVATNIARASADPNLGARDLARIVESDPALSAKVLQTVNSSAYGLRMRIASIDRAVAYMGFRAVRSLAMTASVSAIFKQDRAVGPYRRHGLWTHMVTVGIAARMIAARWGKHQFEEVYLAGLLHDVGIILEDQYIHPWFERAMVALRPGVNLVDIERSVFGLDHTELGARVGEEWRLPPEILAAVRHHHAPEQYSGPHAEILACVVLGNLLASNRGACSVGLNLLGPSPWAQDTLKLSIHDLRVLFEDLQSETQRCNDLFSILGGT